ncbi:MAG TPA: DNA-processing protein DprA [Micromonosporaceae bacterium]|nr:DNA-processing protein DprA [Micromonosporaceae bacterium]
MDDQLARAALACLVEPGNREMWRLVAEHGPAGALDRVRAGEIPLELAATAAPRMSLGDPAELGKVALDRTVRAGGRVITPESPEWPTRVDDLCRASRDTASPHDRDVYPPLCLWLRGAPPLAAAAQRSVAVVGSRAATPYGQHVATELGYGLAERGWTVVSGGAFGIDAHAHRGALAAGGVTVAVLASGIDRAYPLAHANLFERIAEDGLLLSEWPPGAAPHRYRFLIRNRLIAALTRGTVVVEAAARSGARQTCGRARMLGRATMAVPGPVTSAMSVGTHQILRTLEGRLVTSAAEVVEEVGSIGDDLAPLPRGRERDRDRLGATLAQVLDGVPARAGTGPEEIAATAGVALRIAMRALPALEAAGFVLRDDAGWRLAPADDHLRAGTGAPPDTPTGRA